MKRHIAFLLFILPALVFAYGTGYTAYPLSIKNHMISTEAVGITSTGGGVGLQGRYTRKVMHRLIVDGGVGFNGGEREMRLFAGADYEFFPDYMKQPRFSVKGALERANEFDSGRTILTVAPIVSKSMSFWGHEAYPFFSLPTSLNLRGEDNSYASQIAASLGITGKLPFKQYKDLMANLEMQIGLKDSFTAVFAGVSFLLN